MDNQLFLNGTGLNFPEAEKTSYLFFSFSHFSLSQYKHDPTHQYDGHSKHRLASISQQITISTSLDQSMSRVCASSCSSQLPSPDPPTQAITAALLAALADILVQQSVRSSTQRRVLMNWRRTLSIALYGLLWTGPSNHYWQLLLEHLFPDRTDPFRPAKKVTLDQLTYGPLNNIMFMSYISMVVENKSARATRSKLRADYPSVQLAGWRLWPLAQFLNQSFVPLDLRVLFSNVVSLLWTTFMIRRANTAPKGLANPLHRLPTNSIALLTKTHRS